MNFFEIPTLDNFAPDDTIVFSLSDASNTGADVTIQRSLDKEGNRPIPIFQYTPLDIHRPIPMYSIGVVTKA